MLVAPRAELERAIGAALRTSGRHDRRMAMAGMGAAGASNVSMDLVRVPAFDDATVFFVARNHHIDLVGRPRRTPTV